MPGYPRIFAALAVATMAACDLAEPGNPTPLTPVAAGDHLLIADTDRSELVVVAPQNGRLASHHRLALSGVPSLVTPLPGRAAALVLSRTARTIDLFDLTATSAAGHRTFDVRAPFEAVTVSDDARFALAWFPPNTASAVFHNENEVALIDLRPETAPTAAVSRRTLPSLGGAPLFVAFSPPVNGRRYLFALSAEHVAIAAADAPERRERSVPLVSLTSGGTRTPRAVTFGTQIDSAGITTLWAVITTAEANSVYALAITPRTAPAAGEADFDVNLSQLAGIGPGGAATLITLPAATAGGPDRLATLTTNPSAGTVTLTDVLTATGRTLPLSTGLNRIVLFRGERGTDEALVYASNRSSSTFHVVDILAFDSGDQRAVRTRTTREAFRDVMPIPGTARFVVLKTSSANSVGVLDADTDRIAGFGQTGEIKAMHLDSDLDRLFVLTRVSNVDYVVSVNLADLHPENSPVPQAASHLFVLPGTDTVATWTSNAGGMLSLWPVLETVPEKATVIPGLLFDGLLD